MEDKVLMLFCDMLTYEPILNMHVLVFWLAPRTKRRGHVECE